MSLRPFFDTRELADLVEGFESQQLTHEEWDHRAHLALASCYVWRYGDAAVDRIRDGIRALNAAHGVETTPTRGYHESITVAWTRLIASRRAALPTGSGEIELVNDVLEACADKYVLLRYYSRDRIMSHEARYGWVEPDLEPLP
jgi:hypothetical protein